MMTGFRKEWKSCSSKAEYHTAHLTVIFITTQTYFPGKRNSAAICVAALLLQCCLRFLFSSFLFLKACSLNHVSTLSAETASLLAVVQTSQTPVAPQVQWQSNHSHACTITLCKLSNKPPKQQRQRCVTLQWQTYFIITLAGDCRIVFRIWLVHLRPFRGCWLETLWSSYFLGTLIKSFSILAKFTQIWKICHHYFTLTHKPVWLNDFCRTQKKILVKTKL